MSLANNIKKIRESKNISTDTMAKKLGIFKLVYISIEKGIKKPSNELLKKIASIFGISTSEVINYDSVKIETDKRSLDLKNLKDISVVSNVTNISASVVETPLSISLAQPSLKSVSISNVTFIPVSQPTIKETVSKKPMLLDRKDIFSFTNNINIVGVKNILPDTPINTIDPLKELIVNEEKTSSPKIINYVEPYRWKGTLKTMFFTEVNTGLKIGDRVFIVNGNYDSDSLIKRNKYKRKRDGYKVIFVDNCKIALDIDYTGTNPFNQDSIDNFINIYFIKNIDDFNYFNKQLTTKSGQVDYKFNINQNNIVYGDSFYPGKASGWGVNDGISGPGFFIKNGELSWIDVSSQIESGSFSILSNNNSRIRIHNGSFSYSINSQVIDFKENYIYKWEIDKWVVDVEYLQPFISKSNFRDGNFRGDWNSGIYGSFDKKINWTGPPAKWNLGTLLNSKWLSGDMNSLYSLPISFNTEFDNNIPYQKLNAPNNNGNGFNYVIDSELESIVVKNGNIYNSNINTNITQSVVENHITSTTMSFPSVIQGGFFNNSKFKGVEIIGSKLSNCLCLNSSLNNITSINCIYKKSVLKNSIYINDFNIKIIAYDEFTIVYDGQPNKYPSGKVYKFYISETDYNKLKIGDPFYIKDLIIRDGSNYPLNFFDRRFRLSSWTEYFDSYKNDTFTKRGVEVGAFLSTPGDNKWKLNYINTPLTVITEENENKKYSVDIIISIFDNDPSNDALINGPFTKELPINGLSINKSISASISGIQDDSFKIGTGFNGIVNVVKVDSTGRILVGGSFTSYRGVTANRIIRINSDGTIDNTFISGSGFQTGFVSDIKIDNNGKILVGGSFLSYNGVNSIGMIRLNQDGSIDKTFNFLAFPNVSGTKVRSIAIDNNNRIIVGGFFNRYNNQQFSQNGRGNIIRLLDNGDIDNTFNITDGFQSSLISSEMVNIIRIQSDGKILVGGSFASYEGQGINLLARLASNGSLDNTFSSPFIYPNLPITNFVNTIEIQNDGKIITAGRLFSSPGARNIYRLLSNGNIDSTFTPPNFTMNSIPQNSTVSQIKIIDGKLYVVGFFDSPQQRLERLNISDGSVDSTFTINNRFDSNSVANSIDVYQNGKIYIGGLFTTYNNQGYRNIVRINTYYSEPTSLGNNIDISNAFIVNSDFESGLVENSDWISGNHINYNNDVNITSNNSTGGTYSIATASAPNRLLLKTSAKSGYLESDSIDLVAGDIVFLNVEYESINDVTKLPDTYKIIEHLKPTGELELEELGTSGVIQSLTQSGVFKIKDAENRYGYIYKAKIDKTKIKSGIFRRAYITNSFIENENYNVSDRNFSNIPLIKSLLLSDMIFKNTGNILSKATYISSSFINGSDTFNDGIVFKSIWNGMTFSNGVVKESNWINGVFESGTFYDNRSFNASPNITYQYYDVDRTKSYYKSGTTSATVSNNRYSWKNGIFNGGDFYKSDWENGFFNGGKFYSSSFYNGIINGGKIGDNKTKTISTRIYNGIINYTNVENAFLYSEDTSYLGLSTSTIIWNDGLFNDGVFGQTLSNIATWNNGVFNGGEFGSMTKWKNGVFNNGKFTSTLGWTLSNSATQGDYSWEDGVFNGGQFGLATTEANSTWYTGEFNGGKFVGRVWNNGIFSYGLFEGSATMSAIGGASSSNANIFANSFTQSYYGLWRNGVVSNKKDKFIKDKKFFTELKRFNYREPDRKAVISNTLWLNGIFNHEQAEIFNSVWLDGRFERGYFMDSSFNPYVDRPLPSAEFELSKVNGDWVIGDDHLISWGNFTLQINGVLFFPTLTSPSELYSVAGGILENYNNPINSNVKSSYNIEFTGDNSLDVCRFKLTAKVPGSEYRFDNLLITATDSNISIYNVRNLNDFFSPNTIKSFELSDSCYWQNGNLINSDFYISKWEYGNFKIGNSYGMIWKDGISDYMNAFNIFWEKGLWRNGNWYGSYFSYNGDINDDFTKKIINRGISWSGTQSLHVWNLFEDSSIIPKIVGSSSASALS